MKLFPFNVKNDNDKCLITVNYKGEEQTFHPNRFLVVLSKLKDTATQ